MEQIDVNRTHRGLKFLTQEEILSLVCSKQGYLSHYKQNPMQVSKKNKTLVLDIDHTILDASFWLDDVRVGDKVVDNNKRIGIIRLIAVQIIVGLGKETFIGEKIISKNESIPHIGDTYQLETHSDTKNEPKQIQNGFIYEAKLRRMLIVFPNSPGTWLNFQQCYHQLMPHLDETSIINEYNQRRPNIVPVSFYLNDVVVRLRPNLADFLHTVNQYHYDIILFTAATREPYSLILQRLHEWLCNKWNVDALNVSPLWKKIYYRNDCEMIYETKTDRYFYHKNISKLGIDLSQIVIVDDKWCSFKGFEPNAICIGRFDGSKNDNQLLRVLSFLVKVSSSKDVRYELCDLPPPKNENIKECHFDKSFIRSIQFLINLQKHIENQTTKE